MRKILCVMLILALFLSGCSAGAGEGAKAEPTQPPTTTAAAAVEPATTEPAAEMPVSLDSAEYEFVLEDRSVRNANGDVLIEVSYEKVVLLGDAPEFQRINGLIEADCEDFLSRNQELLFGTIEETEAVLPSMGMNYGDLFSTMSARVSHNAGGLLSIHKTMGWFMGGVFNADQYGLTFDLHTGEEVTLADIGGQDPAAFEQQLKEIAAHWLRETYGEGLFSPPEEVLAGYELEDMMFYLEDGQIILAFPTYTFTAGAAGPAVIPTGVVVTKK